MGTNNEYVDGWELRRKNLVKKTTNHEDLKGSFFGITMISLLVLANRRIFNFHSWDELAITIFALISLSIYYVLDRKDNRSDDAWH